MEFGVLAFVCIPVNKWLLPCLKDNSETSKKSPSQVWPLQKSLIPHQILKESHKSISITIAFSVGSGACRYGYTKIVSSTLYSVGSMHGTIVPNPSSISAMID